MKTIVALTNFSAISLNAVHYAADLADVIGADLSLVHVCPLPVAIGEVPVPSFGIEAMIADAEDALKKLKAKLLARIPDGMVIQTEVLLGDMVIKAREYCISVKPYAVVMGSESFNAVERAVFGGKTVAALRGLSWPLIVVPRNVTFFGIRKIGLACDFNEIKETFPLQEIRSIVKTLHAKLYVLHVMNEYEDLYTENIESYEDSEWLLNALRDLDPQYHFIGGNDMESCINEFAERHELELLIVIPRKHNLISKMFRHSHSKGIVLQAHVPVMAIHE